MRRPLVATGLALAVTLAGLAGCTDDGDKDAFCERIGTVPDVGEILASLDSSDPGGIEARIEEGVAAFRALEADAPGDVRADLARLRQGVQLVLDAVRDNPDDLPGARTDILARTDELTGLAQAGTRVATYARTECAVTLGPSDPAGSDPAPSAPDDDPSSTDSGPAEGGDEPTTDDGTTPTEPGG